MVRYVQCLVCGRLTPTDKGICYHCNSPLATELDLPPGMVVCPTCLRLTPVDTGYCRKCHSPLPESLVREAMLRAAKSRLEARPLKLRSIVVVPGSPIGPVVRIGGEP